MSIRQEKVASVIKRIISQPIYDISREVNAGFVTVTSVKITKDLQIVKVYLSIYGKNIQPGKLLDELESRKGELKHDIARNAKLRFTPDLRFYLDDTLDQIEHIQTLLDSVPKSETKSDKDIDNLD